MESTFPELVDRARGLVAGGRRAVLGITGPPGAGKTTLAESLLAALGPGDEVAHVPMDGFHLADVELERLGRRDRKGAPDTFDGWGYASVLRRILADQDEMVYAPGFERVLEQPIAGTIGVSRAARLVITEGNYLLLEDGRWAGLSGVFSEVWYADLEPAERLRRLVARHVRFGKSPEDALTWATGTDERNAELIATTRDRADLVVPSALLRTLGRVS
ncbi:fructose transporter [Actinoplanes sp. SE50]|uniref:nucleoside/nucleotide kinase family protein n=1 Tax=unclassified Actinoplanes TaxID=2626549 RepID=UPI00023ECE57|nr:MULTISPECIES: nucleoside/nucleotide kinase family protein [unclassified Actinoplanes]AEV83795.1 putative fructose transport system kinase [Actinoplanes sp. SE50/110]ATO82061.1 fructose transporter [Actinoplanes sp. SE50]SLL99469.1 nucleoside triphosphate hydrolase [Actinoplanes sp. SE50/110]